MTMAKALGGGFPLSSIGARADFMAAVRPVTTARPRREPGSLRAALAGIDAMDAEGLPSTPASSASAPCAA